MITFYDAIGLTGVFLSLACYARVQWQRDYAKKLSFSVLNLLGSSLLALSIYHNWNLASFVSNAIWIILSAYGVYRCLKYIWRQSRDFTDAVIEKKETP